MPSGVRFAIDRAIKSTATKSAKVERAPSSFFGKKKKSPPKIATKTVEIYPVRGLGGGDVKYYRDSEGRRYEPVVWDARHGYWRPSDSRMHMRRDDGTIFKLRKDGKYQIVIPKQPRRTKPKRK